MRRDTQPDNQRRSRRRAWKPPRSAPRPGTASRSSTPVRTRGRARARHRPPRARSTTRSPRWRPAAARRRSRWRVRYGLMLGLERVLASPTPATAAGHRPAPPPGRRARRHADRADRREPARRRGERQRQRRRARELDASRARARRGGRRLRRRRRRRRRRASRRSRARTRARRVATASAIRPPPGKTIAAAGFVEAARHLGILILTHRRLLVSQFQPRPDDRGLRRPLHRRDRRRARSRSATTRSRSRRTPGSRATPTSSRATAYQLVICDEAHTALGEKTSAAIRSFSDPVYIGMTATEQLIAKQVSDVFPASVDDLPLADAARRGLIAPLRCLRVPPAAAINSVPIVGGDFEERALAAALDHAGAQPGRREPLPRPLRHDAGHRLRRRRRARLQPRAGVPRRRDQGRGRLGQDAAREARRDARRLRARRDQRPHQRAAARRGLELAARDGLLPPRPDRVAPRLPAAHRPDHAHAPAQGGGHRRRLRHQGLDAQRPRRSRSTRCSTPTSTARAPASRRRRGAASSGGRAGSSRRRRGSCP